MFLSTLVILFVVVDPIGLAPIFAALTHDGSAAYRRRMALQGTAIACAILVAFVIFGDPLLRLLGIGLPAFQIAGGALLFLLAVDMVFARQSGIRSTTPPERREAEHKIDISVFPLAFPLIAGPGALTTVLLMSREHAGASGTPVLVLVVVLIVLAATLATLLVAEHILRAIGRTGANVVSRLLGVILAALAVQYVLDGLRTGL